MKQILRKPVWIFYILVTYITIQFSWWLYLIYSLNQKIYSTELLAGKLWMVVGEGMVFLTILVLGVILIRRGLLREKSVIEQQENFILSISHELKTPIASAQLNLQTMSRKGINSETIEDLKNNALNDIGRLNTLVNNLLITKSLGNSNYFLKLEPIAINGFVQLLIGEHFTKSSSRIELNLHPKELYVSADDQALRSILSNLIDNALKYGGLEKPIQIETKMQDETVEIKVKDYGMGIPTDKYLHVLKKFGRLENEMTRTSKGSGLGLYIANQLTKRMAGELILKQNTNEGLTVKIQLKHA